MAGEQPSSAASAADASLSKAPASPPHDYDPPGMPRQAAASSSMSLGNQSGSQEAQAAASYPAAAEQKPAVTGEQRQAGGVQATKQLATRIMNAKCVQEAMQTVQAQHAKHARQSAKLNARPGQPSAPGEGRRQRTRKRKLEGKQSMGTPHSRVEHG